VLKLWEGLGYYARVRNAQAAAQVIVQKFGGRFPTAFDDVLALPGVGRYTAGAVCSIALNQPRPIVDANAARVLSRIFGIGADPRQKAANAQLWKLAQELVEVADRILPSSLEAGAVPCPPRDGITATVPPPMPDQRSARPALRRPLQTDTQHATRNSRHASRITPTHRTCSAFNQSLMELGALICTPLQPKCAVCPARPWCFAYQAGAVGQFPARRAPARVTRRRFIAFIVQKKDRFLTRQRPAGAVNAHFWEFPNIEIGLTAKGLDLLARPFVLTESAPCCRVCHTITRYRIELTAFRAELPEEALKNSGMGVWRTAAQMRRMPMTSAHRRILERLEPGGNS
jgi:A/G-specific adenine glycosylase